MRVMTSGHVALALGAFWMLATVGWGESDTAADGERRVASALPQVAAYRLRVRIEPPTAARPSGWIVGESRLCVRSARGQTMSAISMRLYHGLRVRDVRCDAQPLSFEQQVVPVQPWEAMKVNRIAVHMPAMSPGESRALVVRYEGVVNGYREFAPYIVDGVTSTDALLREDVCWYPRIGPATREGLLATGDERAHYRLYVDVPSSWETVAAGRLRKCETRGGRRLYEWATVYPSPRCDLVCGQFQRIPIAAAITLHCRPPSSAKTVAVAETARRAFALCTQWLGPCPFPDLAIVETPAGSGGQTAPGLILMPSDGLRPEGDTQQEMVADAIGWIGHELSHLWTVPSREEHVSRWLDEGISNYLGGRMLEECAGPRAREAYMDRQRQYFREGGHLAYQTPLAECGRVDEARDPVARGKGPWVLYVLEHMVGREQVDRMLRELRLRHHQSGATLHHFADIASEVSGRRLDKFFDAWFWDTASSDLLCARLTAAEMARRYTEP